MYQDLFHEFNGSSIFVVGMFARGRVPVYYIQSALSKYKSAEKDVQLFCEKGLLIKHHENDLQYASERNFVMKSRPVHGCVELAYVFPDPGTLLAAIPDRQYLIISALLYSI